MARRTDDGSRCTPTGPSTAEKLLLNDWPVILIVTDAIAAVSEAARKFHGIGGQYTVLIGHSFGGLVVERAVAHAINAEMHGHAAPDRSLPR